MEAFHVHHGVVAPLDRGNVDTDAIIPKQYLKSVKRTGFGANLFDDWRYLDPGEPGTDHSKRRPNPKFVLNFPRYRGATVLLTRDNFGCGSSREHAVWALLEYGFRAVIAPGFADIFYTNALKNGLLPVALPGEAVDELFKRVAAREGFAATVDLETQRVCADGETWSFEIEPAYRRRLLEGLDDVGLTLQLADRIRDYERRRAERTPWLFLDP